MQLITFQRITFQRITTLWTLQRFGYTHDLAAEANLCLVVDKLSQDTQL